jgi:hypoxanthine phosphoribosyltransferase
MELTKKHSEGTPTTEQEVLEKYQTTDKKLYMTLDESVSLSISLARQIHEKGGQFDKVIGIANGALLPTKVIADTLGLPYSFITIRRKGSSIKSRLSKYPALVKIISFWFKIPLLREPLVFLMNRFTKLSDDQTIPDSATLDKSILLIDDSVESGQTLVKAEEVLSTGNPDIRITTAVLVAKPIPADSATHYTPDFFLARLMQHFPWSSNNPEYDQYQEWLAENNLQKEQS